MRRQAGRISCTASQGSLDYGQGTRGYSSFDSCRIEARWSPVLRRWRGRPFLRVDSFRCLLRLVPELRIGHGSVSKEMWAAQTCAGQPARRSADRYYRFLRAEGAFYLVDGSILFHLLNPPSAKRGLGLFGEGFEGILQGFDVDRRASASLRGGSCAGSAGAVRAEHSTGFLIVLKGHLAGGLLGSPVSDLGEDLRRLDDHDWTPL